MQVNYAEQEWTFMNDELPVAWACMWRKRERGGRAEDRQGWGKKVEPFGVKATDCGGEGRGCWRSSAGRWRLGVCTFRYTGFFSSIYSIRTRVIFGIVWGLC